MPAEPCMCGATDCRVCGPLQGSEACPMHNSYDCEPCIEYLDKHDEWPEPDEQPWEE